LFLADPIGLARRPMPNMEMRIRVATDTTTQTEEKTGTVVHKTKAEMATRQAGGVQALNQFLADKSNQGGDPDRDPMDGIIQQVLNADSPAAVLTPTEALQASNLIQVPLMLVGWELAQSEYDAGSPFYANLAVLTPDGQPNVVNCGHKKVLAQLIKLEEFNEYPYRVMFITRGQSRQGTPMLELTAWEEEAEPEPAPF
jgi:hypothetical protein